MINRELPHLLVLPEDDANRQLANGFVAYPDLATRRIQILPPAGGWIRVRERFASAYVSQMDRYSQSLMLLLVDFDQSNDRRADTASGVPPRLTDRVFVLGTWSTPERLKRELGSYERIGLLLATECHKEHFETWQHPLLRHNAAELTRLNRAIRGFLFV